MRVFIVGLVALLVCVGFQAQAQEKKKTTFTATLTFDSEAVAAFADHLGWKEYVPKKGSTAFDIDVEPNPVSAEQFIAEEFKKFSYGFTLRYAQHLKQAEMRKAVAPIEKRLDEVLVEPIKNATVVDWVKDE
jgi:hypothetical protein